MSIIMSWNVRRSAGSFRCAGRSASRARPRSRTRSGVGSTESNVAAAHGCGSSTSARICSTFLSTSGGEVTYSPGSRGTRPGHAPQRRDRLKGLRARVPGHEAPRQRGRETAALHEASDLSLHASAIMPRCHTRISLSFRFRRPTPQPSVGPLGRFRAGSAGASGSRNAALSERGGLVLRETAAAASFSSRFLVELGLCLRRHLTVAVAQLGLRVLCNLEPAPFLLSCRRPSSPAPVRECARDTSGRPSRCRPRGAVRSMRCSRPAWACYLQSASVPWRHRLMG